MGKIITSPVKRWRGTVTLSDPLTIPQVMAYEDAMRAGKEAALEHGNTVQVKNKSGEEETQANFFSARYLYTILPGVCACVEKWELEGLPAVVTAENFPGSPKMDSARLLSWIIGEISKLYTEAEEVPNA